MSKKPEKALSTVEKFSRSALDNYEEPRGLAIMMGSGTEAEWIKSFGQNRQ